MTQRFGGGPVDRFHSNCECPFTDGAICCRRQRRVVERRESTAQPRNTLRVWLCFCFRLQPAPVRNDVSSARRARLAVLLSPSLLKTLCILCCAALLRPLARLCVDRSGCLATAHALPASAPHVWRSPSRVLGVPHRCLFGNVTHPRRHGLPGARPDWRCCAGIGRVFAGLAGEGRLCGLTGRQPGDKSLPA